MKETLSPYAKSSKMNVGWSWWRLLCLLACQEKLPCLIFTLYIQWRHEKNTIEPKQNETSPKNTESNKWNARQKLMSFPSLLTKDIKDEEAKRMARQASRMENHSQNGRQTLEAATQVQVFVTRLENRLFVTEEQQVRVHVEYVRERTF